MNFVFNFPDLGEGLEEGTIMEWYVKKGDRVTVGMSLVQMETDKVVADIPSPKNGIITALHGEVGDVIKVDSPLAEIEVEGSDVVGSEVERKEIEVKEVDPKEDAGAVVGTMEVAGADGLLPASKERISEPEPLRPFETQHQDEYQRPFETQRTDESRKALATPVARAMAKQMNIDINEISGSGPSGRVKKADVLNFKNIPEDVTYKPLTQIRKTIAKNMIQSKHSAAHMSVFEEAEITELMLVRSRYRQKFAGKGVKLTYLPFIVKAVAQALKHHPQLNSQIDMENNRMIYRNRYHIGIAVDTSDGLVVPVIRDADRLSIFQVAKMVGELAEKARTRKLALNDLRDGSFSITSFGSFGGIYATPVLNYPQAGILGIGRILKTPVVKGDEIIIGNIMPFSLTVDHRIVDGAEATRFIYKVMEYLTDPVSFLMEE